MSAASDIVDAHMRSCLPPGVPTSYERIVSARQTRTGRAATWRAEVVMFDGQPATIEVFRYGRAFDTALMVHRWVDMPGGACLHENGRWQRLADDPSSNTQGAS